MPDHEVMDDVLRAAMSGPPPVASADFAAGVLRRTAPRRWTTAERLVLWSYAAASIGVCAWLMWALPPAVTAGALAVEAFVAVALRSYTSRLVNDGN